MNDAAVVPTTRKYELFLCLDANLTEKETKNELKKIKDIIAESGEIFHEQTWGKRDLYYKMNKQEKGLYTLVSFTLIPAKITELKRDLGLMPSVYRYNIQTLPDNYIVPVRPEKTADVVEEVEKPVHKTVKKTVAPKPIPMETTVEVVEEITEPVQDQPEVIVEQDPEKPSVSARGKMTNFDEGLDKIISDLS